VKFIITLQFTIRCYAWVQWRKCLFASCAEHFMLFLQSAIGKGRRLGRVRNQSWGLQQIQYTMCFLAQHIILLVPLTSLSLSYCNHCQCRHMTITRSLHLPDWHPLADMPAGSFRRSFDTWPESALAETQCTKADYHESLSTCSVKYHARCKLQRDDIVCLSI